MRQKDTRRSRRPPGGESPRAELSATGSALSRVVDLPRAQWDECWERIITRAELKERLLGQSILSLGLRQKLSTVGTAVHGLIVLAGPAGTGKSTLCRGLANELAKQIEGLRFGEIDADALPSDLLGQSQHAVKRLFEVEMRDLVDSVGVAVLLIDEVESLAVNRSEASLKANPVDVHRATNALLDGLDQAAETYKNLLILATTNFIAGVDDAFLSRADAVIPIPLPDEKTALAILKDTLAEYAKEWPALKRLAVDPQLGDLAQAATGLSGRTLRKIVMQAAASSVQTAKDPGKMSLEQVRLAVEAARILELPSQEMRR